MMEPTRLVAGGSPSARALLRAGKNDAPPQLLVSAIVGSLGVVATPPVAGRLYLRAAASSRVQGERGSPGARDRERGRIRCRPRARAVAAAAAGSDRNRRFGDDGAAAGDCSSAEHEADGAAVTGRGSASAARRWIGRRDEGA